MFEVVFLGTMASVPSKERNMTATLVKHNGKRFLIDCAEGTLRQVITCGERIREPFHILITHEHLDHLLGLGGLLYYLDVAKSLRELNVFCGPGASSKVRSLKDMAEMTSELKININEISGPQVIYEDRDLFIKAFKTDHTDSSYGFILMEKEKRKFLPDVAANLGVPKGRLWKDLQDGKAVTLENGKVVTSDMVLGPPQRGAKLVVISDSAFKDEFIEICKDVDALVTEMTYLDKDASEALSYKHLTSSQVAHISKSSNVGMTYINHISPRYEDSEVVSELMNKIPKCKLVLDLEKVIIGPAHGQPG